MANTIIGRNKETRILSSVMALNRPEFIALYGRRRIGKTFLVREFFTKKM